MVDVLSAKCWVILWGNTFPSYMPGAGEMKPFPEQTADADPTGDGRKFKVYTLVEAKARLAELQGPKAWAYPSTKFALDCDTDLVDA